MRQLGTRIPLPHGPLKVVYLEDRDAHVGTLANLLSPKGFIVAGVASPDEAVAQALECGLLIVDLNLPGYGPVAGLDVLRDVRTQAPLAFVAVVSANAARRRRALEMGADLFVEKGDMGDTDGMVAAGDVMADAVAEHVRIVKAFRDDPLYGDGLVVDHLVRARWCRDPAWRAEVGNGVFGVSEGRIVGPSPTADALVWSFRTDYPDGRLLVVEPSREPLRIRGGGII